MRREPEGETNIDYSESVTEDKNYKRILKNERSETSVEGRGFEHQI